MKGQVTIGDGPGVYFTLGMGLHPRDPPSLTTLEALSRRVWSPEVPSPSSRGLTPASLSAWHRGTQVPLLLHAQTFWERAVGEMPFCSASRSWDFWLPGTQGSPPWRPRGATKMNECL